MKSILDLPWTSTFVDQLPGDPERQNFTRRVQNVLYSEVKPTKVSKPNLIAWSWQLADELKLAYPEPASAQASREADLLAGNLLLPMMKPYAARYGGHQFGNWAGALGDGRAITLGEVKIENQSYEFQLKGGRADPLLKACRWPGSAQVLDSRVFV